MAQINTPFRVRRQDVSPHVDNQTLYGIAMTTGFRKYMCVICGWIYDEQAGAPGEGLAPGSRWADVPPDWQCPDCGAGREDFDMVEI
jgi:rubredoxin